MSWKVNASARMMSLNFASKSLKVKTESDMHTQLLNDTIAKVLLDMNEQPNVTLTRVEESIENDDNEDSSSPVAEEDATPISEPQPSLRRLLTHADEDQEPRSDDSVRSEADNNSCLLHLMMAGLGLMLLL